jgi:uncharacterized protein
MLQETNMSEQANVELIQTAFECFGRGDVAGVLATLADDVEWYVATVENVPYTGTRHGKAGAGEFFQLMAEAEDTLKFEPREFVAQGDMVVVLGHYEARAKSTGRQFATYFVQFFTVQNGKITRFREFTDTAAEANAFMKAQTA